MTKIDAIIRYCNESKNLHIHLMGHYAMELSDRRWTDEKKVAKFRERVRCDLKRFTNDLRRMDESAPRITRAVDDVKELRALDAYVGRVLTQGEYAINHR